MSKTVNPLFMMIPCVCATQGGGRLCAYSARARKTQCIESLDAVPERARTEQSPRGRA